MFLGRCMMMYVEVLIFMTILVLIGYYYIYIYNKNSKTVELFKYRRYVLCEG